MTGTETLTVAVVDDATLVRDSFAHLVPGVRDGGRFARVEDLLEAVPEVDLVVLDLHLSTGGQQVRQGVSAVRLVTRAGYRVCTYSQDERPLVLAACLAAGATGVLSKSDPIERVAAALADVAGGELVAPPAVLGLLDVLVRRRSLTVIGPRQREVLTGRARGLSYAQLATRLHLSESTLRGYWRDLSEQVTRFLDVTTPAAIEADLGLAPGDLLDLWPGEGLDELG